MTNKFNIKDESGDRKYFTQIPNMIVNHSTAYEQSLYLIMKRIAGETGSCYASLNYLAQKMGVNRKTVTSNIAKLLKRKWIAEISPIKIRGGKVRQFIIIDLWKVNMKEYNSGAKKDIVEVGLLFPEVGLIRTQGGAVEDTKKNHKNNKEQSVCLLLSDWNERQQSPMINFIPENIVNKYGSAKIEELMKTYGKQNEGFSMMLNSLGK